MNTPIYDYLQFYKESDASRFHMPGHKGRFAPPPLAEAAMIDLTEIEGADSLFDAHGIIAQSERNAARLYGSSVTFYSCAGSTLCIQTMLLLMKQEGRPIVAMRGVHQSFLHAAVLLDLEVHWVYPRRHYGVLSGVYLPDDFEEELKNLRRPACVYVTSPDYFGQMVDVSRFSAVCKRYAARLLVDNAHGAHLAFLPHRAHPIQLGADYCCDSAHKMISGLTGTAYLHVHSDIGVDESRVRGAMAMFASTSPSYLMLCSLDWCNRQLESPLFRRQLSDVSQRALEMRRRFGDKYHFHDSEPLHMTIHARESGFDGREMYSFLRDKDVTAEYADRYDVILLLSAATDGRDFRRLENALETFLPTSDCAPARATLPHPEKVCSMREACLTAQEEIDVRESAGRICASVHVPCPPAIPIAVSGERIDAACIETYLAYGIDRVRVVQ